MGLGNWEFLVCYSLVSGALCRFPHREVKAAGGMLSVTLDDLEKRLWDAANALRGPVDPADFKTYVFPILFW